MKNRVFFAFVFATLFSSPAFIFCKGKPTKAGAPLSADEIAVYKALLGEYASDHSASLNVSDRTYPIDPESHMGASAFRECLKDIALDNPTTASHTYHYLTGDVLPGKNMKLVNPARQSKIARDNDPDKTIGKGNSVEAAVKQAFATGLFSLSEIAFDKEHRYAIVSYGFRCGALCGHGYTLLFEKVGSEWKNTKRNCGGWIS